MRLVTAAEAVSSIDSGDRVYVHFGADGTAALTTDGKVAWRERFPYESQHGNGGSPTIYKDLLIFSADGSDTAFVVALDKQTGKVRWKTYRRAPADQAYSTPLAIRVGERDQIVSVGAFRTGAYDPEQNLLMYGIGNPGPDYYGDIREGDKATLQKNADQLKKFDFIQVTVEGLPGLPRGPVDPLEHGLVLVPPPVGAGAAQQLEGRHPVRGGDMRSAAQVRPGLSILGDVAVDAEGRVAVLARFDLGAVDLLDDLQLVRLAGEELARLGRDGLVGDLFGGAVEDRAAELEVVVSGVDAQRHLGSRREVARPAAPTQRVEPDRSVVPDEPHRRDVRGAVLAHRADPEGALGREELVELLLGPNLEESKRVFVLVHGQHYDKCRQVPVRWMLFKYQLADFGYSVDDRNSSFDRVDF